MAEDEDEAAAARTEKASDRRFSLLTAVIGAGVVLLGAAIGALVTFATTNRQLSEQAATSQAEFIRENRQRVYAEFVAHATEFHDKVSQIRSIDFLDAASGPAVEDFLVAGHAALAKVRDELALSHASVRLVATGHTFRAANEVFTKARDIFVATSFKMAKKVSQGARLAIVSSIGPYLNQSVPLPTDTVAEAALLSGLLGSLEAFVAAVRSELGVKN